MRPMLRSVAVLVLGLAAGMGCALAPRAPVMAPYGAGFNQTKVPMNLRYRATALGAKQGTASATTILGLFTFGDASIAAAARQGNIARVTHADSEVLNVLGLFAEFKTVVYGD